MLFIVSGFLIFFMIVSCHFHSKSKEVKSLLTILKSLLTVLTKPLNLSKEAGLGKDPTGVGSLVSVKQNKNQVSKCSGTSVRLSFAALLYTMPLWQFVRLHAVTFFAFLPVGVKYVMSLQRC